MSEFFSLVEYQEHVLLIARVVVGVALIYFGWPKIKDLKSNAEDFNGMGFKPGWFWGTIVALVEVVGGVALILGVGVWLVAILFGFEMAVGTVWKATKTDKPFADYSFDIVLIVLALIFLAFGSGMWALL